METFATAVAGPLRCVLSRLALINGEAFFFTFMEEARLDQGAITGSIPIDAALARAGLAGAAPATGAEQVATIARVIDHGPVRGALGIGQPGSNVPWIVQAFFGQIDAIAEAEQIAAATGRPAEPRDAAASPWDKSGGPI